jgi:hypothetical protein
MLVPGRIGDVLVMASGIAEMLLSIVETTYRVPPRPTASPVGPWTSAALFCRQGNPLPRTVTLVILTQAVDGVIAAYLREGLQVETELRSASFARLEVRSVAESAKVELGLDWRKNEPVRLAVGPVLQVDDAVANKVCALFGRAEVRDHVDVDAILTSGRYAEYELLDLAADHDPGFDQSWFAEVLAAIDRLPDSLFRPYGMSPEDTAALRNGCAHGPGGSAPPNRQAELPVALRVA